MPAAIPLAMMAASTAASVYGAKKAANAAKLDPQTQALQNQALQMQNERMRAFNPVYMRMVAGANNRLPASYGGGGGTSAMGQALQAASRGLPGPTGQRRQRYQDMV